MFVRLLAATGMAAFSFSVFAFPGAVGHGPNATYGKAVHGLNLHATAHNPASTAQVLDAGKNFRMGVLGSLAVGYELGQVDNFIDDLDELLEELERTDLTVLEGIDKANRFNDIVATMGRDGYARLNVGLQAPLTPLAVRTPAGVVTLSLQGDAEVKVLVLDDIISYQPASQELDTRTSLYLKSAQINRISLGLSRDVWERDDHQLFGGARLSLISAAMSKQVVNLKAAAMDSEDDEVGDIVSDQYDINEKTSTNVSIDLGVTYQYQNWRTGLTLSNINEPEFDYGTVGNNCLSLPAGSLEHTNCLTANYFAVGGRIARNETWTMNSQATWDGSYSFANGRGLVGASYDLTDANTPTGDLVQQFSLVAAYQSPRFWLPGVRGGYHKNMAGSELSSVSFGLTWFNRLTFDAVMGLEDVNLDGSKVPRMGAISLGWQSSF